MSNLASITDSAKTLSKNPLGLLALFIVLIYGIAALFLSFAKDLSVAERLPLVWFLVLFPILVLSAFLWLVSRHGNKLYSPSDFKDEENYVKMQLSAVASLTAAVAKNRAETTDNEIANIIDTVRSLDNKRINNRENHILWVDDRPENNQFERKAFEAIGIEFTLSLSTNDALFQLDNKRFAAIISDMGRKEGPQEGYVLLDEIRRNSNDTPFFIFSSSNLPKHKQKALQQGAQGSTNNGQELFQMVTKSILTRK